MEASDEQKKRFAAMQKGFNANTGSSWLEHTAEKWRKRKEEEKSDSPSAERPRPKKPYEEA